MRREEENNYFENFVHVYNVRICVLNLEQSLFHTL